MRLKLTCVSHVACWLTLDGMCFITVNRVWLFKEIADWYSICAFTGQLLIALQSYAFFFIKTSICFVIKYAHIHIQTHVVYRHMCAIYMCLSICRIQLCKLWKHVNDLFTAV
jgi:hypothetical protein